jgi:hypothetical protein
VEIFKGEDQSKDIAKVSQEASLVAISSWFQSESSCFAPFITFSIMLLSTASEDWR